MRLKVLPLPSSRDGDWISVHRLVTSVPGEIADPTAALRRCRQLWLDVGEAYRQQAAERFNQVSAAFLRQVSHVGSASDNYPSTAMIKAELTYHNWRPFRLAWVLATAACLLGICSLLSRRGGGYRLALVTLAAAAVVMCLGFGWRMFLAGRAPVTNMYESMIYVALGTSLLGLVLQRKQPQKLVLVATAAISAVVLLLADSFPENLDPGFQPLPPALRTNFWLVVHVLSVTFSYSAFTVSLGIGNITLGYFLFRSRADDAVTRLDRLNDLCLQLGVLLLTVGTVTGGIWADYSWGRFWGWDPKEVWSLVTLAGYLAVLHARYTGLIGPFGFAGLSVICYSLVVITWYGVNFLLGTGLHSYGGGSGGLLLVTVWLAVQFGYVAVAATRSAVRPR
jgi:ABC-type transport system involved in cytochrome c biogenesis permease subunit